MRISTNQADEYPMPGKPGGGYEWWYFDAISNDGLWKLVVIFYQGNPFSPEYIIENEKGSATPEKFPAISVSMYKNNKAEYYSFLEYGEESLTANKDPFEIKLGYDRFVRNTGKDETEYVLKLNQELESGFKVKGELSFRSSIANNQLIEIEGEEDFHTWNLLQPKARVEGSLQIQGRSGNQSIDFQGSGYHDHNTGLEPLKNDFDDWYWGRYHFNAGTLIYYIMNKKGKQYYKAWLIDKENQSVIETFDDVQLDRFKRNKFGLKFSSDIVLNSEKYKVRVSVSSILDSGPFYLRMAGEAELTERDKKEKSKGISEFIKPEKIYFKVFWPAVRMRLQFMNKKPHWVQKSGFFYPWTW